MNHADIVIREAHVQGLIDDHSERERIRSRDELKDKEMRGTFTV